MASENEDRETLADIVAEIRAYGAQPPPRLMWLDIADRLEAAWKRDEERAVEHATRHAEAVARDNCRDCVYNPKGKNYEGGNAAALREACEKMLPLLMLRGDGKAYCVLSWDEFNESQKMLRAVLSAPARNCDRFGDLKSAQRHYIEHGCPKGLGMLVDGEIRKFPWKSQFEKWLFAPAAERKGEGDGR